jgi:predicted metalloenzyme YecM
LLQPKKGSFYPTGLEHCEFVIPETLDAFIKRYPDVEWDLSAMNKSRNADVRVEFEGGKISVKFHCQPLEKIIEDELAEEKGLKQI